MGYHFSVATVIGFIAFAGVVSVVLLTLAVIPCAYSVWRGRRLP